jgi:hypothetical protein
MKENKLILFEDAYEYDLTIEDGKYSLYYNNSEYWQQDVRGTLAFEMINNGNEWRFKTKKKNTLNYSESFYMYLILALEKDYKLGVVDNVREL